MSGISQKKAVDAAMATLLCTLAVDLAAECSVIHTGQVNDRTLVIFAISGVIAAAGILSGAILWLKVWRRRR